MLQNQHNRKVVSNYVPELFELKVTCWISSCLGLDEKKLLKSCMHLYLTDLHLSWQFFWVLKTNLNNHVQVFSGSQKKQNTSDAGTSFCLILLVQITEKSSIDNSLGSKQTSSINISIDIFHLVEGHSTLKTCILFSPSQFWQHEHAWKCH